MSFIPSLAPRVSIQVSPDLFVFWVDGASLSLPTYLYIEPGVSAPRVLAVGEAPAGPGPQERVDLFGSAADPTGDRMWALETFLRYAIRKSVGSRIMVRPVVTVTGLDSLEPALHGYQGAILTEALIAAGAQEVDYPELKRAA